MRANDVGVDHVTGVSVSKDLVLEIAPDPEHARTARLFAAATARHFNVGEEKIEDLKVAISEACTNSFRAHQVAGVTDPVRVVAARTDAGLRFSVMDSGAGFEPRISGTEADDAYTPPGGIFEGSLGLALILSLFPDTAITRNPDRGMTVSFVVDAD